MLAGVFSARNVKAMGLTQELGAHQKVKPNR